MTALEHGRLLQERWFTVVRWLLIEAFILQVNPQSDLPRFLESRLGPLLAGLAAYTLIITVLVLVRRSWPAPLAGATATIDTLLAVAITTAWSPDTLNPAAAGVAAAAVAVGVRRFPVFETSIYSYLIVLGMIGGGFLFTGRLPLGIQDAVFIGSVAILPVLVRAATLEPGREGPEDPVIRLMLRGLESIKRLASAGGHHQELLQTSATALADYSDAQIGGVVVNRADGSVDLFTAVDGQVLTERLQAPTKGDLVERLVNLHEPVSWTRRDNLHARGFPSQYPAQLDGLVAAPLPNLSTFGAAVFAANSRRTSFRHDDRIMAYLIGREAARVTLERELTMGSSEALTAASEALIAAADAKREGTRAQAEESARFAEAIAIELGWTGQALDDIRLAALLHDIGEIAVPDAILDKTEALTPEEFERIKQHPWVAAKIIDSLNRSELVLGSIYAHHERWDGQGYPSGLEGENIPQGGRVLGLAHATAAMLRGRPFRPALSATDALQEVILGSGTQFDPTIVQAFLAVIQRQGHAFLEPRESARAQSSLNALAPYRGLGGP